MASIDTRPPERTSGVSSIFSLAWAYRLAQWSIGAVRSREIFVGEILGPTPDDRIIDIGCGTADILEQLPDLDYQGFDHSERYVDSARARFGDRARFTTAAAGSFVPASHDRTIAMAIGVLHHVDDGTAADILRLATASLVPGGRFVSIDPTIVEKQPTISRFLVSHDRGQHVRTPEQTEKLFAPHFEAVEVQVRHDLLRVPYSHVIVQATGPRNPDMTL